MYFNSCIFYALGISSDYDEIQMLNIDNFQYIFLIKWKQLQKISKY